MPKAGAEWIFPVFFGGALVVMGIGWVIIHAAHAVRMAGWPIAVAILAAAAIIAAVIIANRREARRAGEPRFRPDTPPPPRRSQG